MYETVISPAELAERLSEYDVVLVDCRYVLGRPGRGRASYLDKHLPGAVYADLEEDLSGPVAAGSTGRHPLPGKRDLVSLIRRLGITNASQVVAYDEGPGYMAAARLWWMLKWSGHDAVAVLDGGLLRWTDLGLPLEREVRTPKPGDFQPHFRDEMVVSAAEIESSLGDGALTLIDSRSPDRFRGENETIDPVAGHIPGALCLPFNQNLDSTSAFLAPDDLRRRFSDVVGEQGASGVAFYCGSGVTAAHNVLAFYHAGLGLPRLYPGSWSEWIT
ncbi:MAG: sulfurtransferase, partial [Actinobacteria bacterium]|nr:sulfurtransferase [Actinomycetota bacterium]